MIDLQANRPTVQPKARTALSTRASGHAVLPAASLNSSRQIDRALGKVYQKRLIDSR